MMNKRIFATLVAMGMIASMGTMAVSAEEPAATTGDSATYTDAGKVEAIIDTSIVKATLPTVADGTFDFILDPQALIQGSSGGSLATDPGYDSATGTLLFQSDEGVYTEMSQEIKLEFVNAVDTDVTVKAAITGADSLTFSTTKDFGAAATASAPAESATAEEKAAYAQGEADSKAHIYLAIAETDGAGAIKTTGSPATDLVKVLGATGGTYSTKVDAIDSGDLTVEYAAGTGYSYTADTPSEFHFALTGKANPNAPGWTNLTQVAPQVELTWTLKKHVDINYLSANTINSSNRKLTLSMGSDVSVKSVKINKTDGSSSELKGTEQCNITSTALTISSTIVSKYVGQTITVTYSDGLTDTITITE